MKTRGSVGKLKRTVQQICIERGVDPISVLIDLIENDEYRFAAAKELASYCYPKLQATQFTLENVPDEIFDQEVERRVNLKILKGEKIG